MSAGLRLYLTPHLNDGDAFRAGANVFIGTRPVDALEEARRDAVRIVRAGLADECRWLGINPYPTWTTHTQLLQQLKEPAMRAPYARKKRGHR